MTEAKNTAVEIRSLSPAYWYVCDREMARRNKNRGQVSPSFGSKVEVQRWLDRRAAIAKLEAS